MRVWDTAVTSKCLLYSAWLYQKMCKGQSSKKKQKATFLVKEYRQSQINAFRRLVVLGVLFADTVLVSSDEMPSPPAVHVNIISF
jgi:hypothetical protein